MPSTRISGSGLPVKVAIPRIQNWASSLPGSPEVCNATTPARLPASVWLSDRTGTRSSSGRIVEMAPTTDSRFWVP